jgi:hypothetical protein
MIIIIISVVLIYAINFSAINIYKLGNIIFLVYWLGSCDELQGQ